MLPSKFLKLEFLNPVQVKISSDGCTDKLSALPNGEGGGVEGGFLVLSLHS